MSVINDYYIPFLFEDLPAITVDLKTGEVLNDDVPSSQSLLTAYKTQITQIRNSINQNTQLSDGVKKELENRFSINKNESQQKEKLKKYKELAQEYARSLVTQCSEKAKEASLQREREGTERLVTRVLDIKGKEITGETQIIGVTGGVRRHFGVKEGEQMSMIISDFQKDVTEILSQWYSLSNKQISLQKLDDESYNLAILFQNKIKDLQNKLESRPQKGTILNQEYIKKIIREACEVDVKRNNNSLEYYFNECVSMLEHISFIQDLSNLNGVYGESLTALILSGADLTAKQIVDKEIFNTFTKNIKGGEKTVFINAFGKEQRNEQDKIDVVGTISFQEKTGNSVEEEIRASVKARSSYSSFALQESVQLMDILVALERNKKYLGLTVASLLGDNGNQNNVKNAVDDMQFLIRYVGASRGNPLKNNMFTDKTSSANVLIILSSNFCDNHAEIIPMSTLLGGTFESRKTSGGYLKIQPELIEELLNKNKWVGQDNSAANALARSRLYIQTLSDIKLTVLYMSQRSRK